MEHYTAIKRTNHSCMQQHGRGQAQKFHAIGFTKTRCNGSMATKVRITWGRVVEFKWLNSITPKFTSA